MLRRIQEQGLVQHWEGKAWRRMRLLNVVKDQDDNGGEEDCDDSSSSSACPLILEHYYGTALIGAILVSFSLAAFAWERMTRDMRVARW